MCLINSTASLGYMLWTLGYPDKAREQQARMVSLLAPPLDPYAHCIGTVLRLAMSCYCLRDYTGMREQAERLLALAHESEIALFSPVGLIWLGRVMVAEGDVDSGMQAIGQGRRALMSQGDLAMYDLYDYDAAEACLQARKIDEGLVVINEAIAKSTAGSLQPMEAEMHRLKGELLLLAGSPESEAEDSFRRAIAISQGQEAKSWELRATTSLAGLLMKQNRRDEARSLLTEIYNWFTEGFDTADLRDAKALLEELASP